MKNGTEGRKERSQEASEQIINFKQDNTKRKGSDTSELSKLEDDLTSNGSYGWKQALTTRKTNAVAFHIPTGQVVCKPPPKRFCNQTNLGRENISLERLTEKQKMAERRKNQQVEQRLKRIHDRQEAARKLAQNVEILLQQRSISGAGRGSSCHNTHHMTSSELFATARHVARDFRTLTSQMTKDFALDDKNNNVAQKNSTCIKTRQAKHSLAESSVNDNNRSVAFTVGFDDDKGPLSPVPKAFKVPNKTQKTRLTAEELEEKQRKAEERRTQRQQDRVKRVIANREALLKLASDLETFMIWSDTDKHSPATCGDDKTMRNQYQAAQLANEIADGFDRLSQRYTRDLKQAEGFSCTWWNPK